MTATVVVRDTFPLVAVTVKVTFPLVLFEEDFGVPPPQPIALVKNAAKHKIINPLRRLEGPASKNMETSPNPAVLASQFNEC